ncbi:MAG: DUF1992 domain-containing protein [Nocardioidaceae bacterium]
MVGEYESSVDRQIREAQERGEFDNLPGAGKPLEFLGKPQDENWWVKRLIERERLDMTAALPPQLALRKERQALPERILRERTEEAARDLVEDFNARVSELWRRPVEGPLVAVRPADVDELLAHWRTSRATPSAQARPPAPKGQRRAWPWLGRALIRRWRRS